MLLKTITSALALCGYATAFSDTSPFILVSSKSIDVKADGARIQTSSQVESTAKELLRGCPTDRYLVVSQPNLHASDLRKGRGVANLRGAVDDAAGSWIVDDVYGEVSADGLAAFVRDSCAASSSVEVEEVKLAPLPTAEADRPAVLATNDKILGDAIRALGSHSFVLLYLSSPAELVYEAESHDTLPGELKRRGQDYLVANPMAANMSEWNKRPLFEKYVFFHPGLFMTLAVSIILLIILYGGLRSIASLNVSYGAFDKENGPAQQKKQQ